jgi:hypothetical protein
MRRAEALPEPLAEVHILVVTIDHQRLELPPLVAHCIKLLAIRAPRWCPPVPYGRQPRRMRSTTSALALLTVALCTLHSCAAAFELNQAMVIFG